MIWKLRYYWQSSELLKILSHAWSENKHRKAMSIRDRLDSIWKKMLWDDKNSQRGYSEMCICCYKKKIIGQSKWSKNENLQKCCTWRKSKRKRRYVKREAENHHAVPLKIIYLIYLIYLFFWASGIPTMSNTDQYVNTSKAKKFTCENFQYQFIIMLSSLARLSSLILKILN